MGCGVWGELVKGFLSCAEFEGICGEWGVGDSKVVVVARLLGWWW